MIAFRLSPEASQDIIEIYEYIAQDSFEAAERVRVELLARISHTKLKKAVASWHNSFV
jgi:plasmid stabilization system protein ParE